MKFKITVYDLHRAVRAMRDVAPASGPLVDTAGVKIVVVGDTATFYTFSLDTMAKMSVKIVPVEDGEAIVDPSKLYGAVSSFKDTKEDGVGTGIVTFSTSPKTNRVQISARTTYASGVTIPHKRVIPIKLASGFLDEPPTSKVKLSFEVPTDVLVDGFASVAYALSSDQQQVMFTGVLLQLEEERLTLFATNGICLAEYSTGFKYSGPKIRIIIPGALAQKVSKNFADTTILTCSLTKSMFYVSASGLVIGGTLIGEKFPDYKSVLPVPAQFAEIDKGVFLDNLLSLVFEASSIDDNRVSTVIGNGEAFLRCSQSENSGIPAKLDGSMEFDCNLKLLAGSVKNIYGDTLKIGFAGKGKPLTFSSANQYPGGTELNCVLVPLTT